MATYGVQHIVHYQAWDQTANAPKTGDATNHTLRWIKDGVSAVPTNAPVEVDATNAPGIYSVTLTATECQAEHGTLAGKSATANVTITPVSLSFVKLPSAIPGSAGGLPTVDGSNHIAGVQGTLNVNVAQISGDATAADNLEAILDGTGAALTLSNTLSVNTTQISGDATAADNLEAILDGTGGQMYLKSSTSGLSALRVEATAVTTPAVTVTATGTGSPAIRLLDTTGDGIEAPGGLQDVSDAAASGVLAVANNKISTDANGKVSLADTDGVTDSKLRELVLAAIAGTTSIVDNGDGTKTLTFYKQDGTTKLLNVTFNTTSGTHTSTTIDPP